MKNKRFIYLPLFLIIIIAITLRFLPFLIYREPFSTDIWPLIRASKTLAKASAYIWDDQYFDGYNNRWPGVILSTSIASLILDLDIVYVYSYLYLIAISSAYIVLLYVLIRRLSSCRSMSILGLLYFISAPSLLIFSSAILKEVYAYPQLITIVLLVLIYNSKSYSYIALFLSSLALVITHHLASMMIIGILLSSFIVLAILLILGFCRDRECFKVIKNIAMAIAMLTILFFIYITIYGGKGFRYRLGIEDISGIFIYAFFIYISYAISSYLKNRRFLSASAISIAIIITILASIYSIIYGITINLNDISLHIIASLAPLITLCLLPNNINIAKVFIIGQALFLATSLSYLYIARPEFVNILHRVANYVVFLNTISIAYTACRGGRFTKAFSITISILALFSGIICLSSIILGENNSMFYWLYRESEVKGFSDIARLSTDNIILLGDDKIFYFMNTIRNVDTLSIIKILYKNSLDCCKGSIVILYQDNLIKGYVNSLTIYDTKNLIHFLNGFNRLYDCRSVIGLEVI